MYRLVSNRAPRQIGTLVSTKNWVELGLLIYIVCFWVVILSLHHGDFKSRVQELRTRRTIGVFALVMAPLSIVIGILALLYLALRWSGREIAAYAGFGGESG